MKTMKKLLLTAGMLALLMLPVQAEDAEPVYMPAHAPAGAEEEMTGSSGFGETSAAFQEWNNIQWEFDETTGTLTITGQGKMPGWSFRDAPWVGHAAQVKTVIVGEGITYIDSWVLSCRDMPYTALHLPSTLEYIDVNMLENTSLNTITVAEGGMYYVEDNVLFCKDGNMVTLSFYPGGLTNTEYTVPEGVSHIGRSAFVNRNLKKVTLPESLVGIGYVAFDGAYSLTEITIPAGVSEIDLAAFVYSGLQNIYVDPDNTCYTSVDGVLFTKDMSMLHTYPERKEGNGEYTVPDGVTDVVSTIMSLSYIRKLYLPASVERLVSAGTGASSSAWLREIYVAEDNPYMTSVDGILYSKDVTELLWYPNNHSNIEYTVPDTVEHIYSSSFWWITNLQTVIFNDKVSVDGFLQWGNTLTAMYFPGNVPAWLNDACRSVKDQAILYYPNGNPTWTDGSMTVDGYTYTTAAYGEGVEDSTVWNTWENIEWFYYDVTGILKVRGTGTIPDVEYAEYPWNSYRFNIKNLTVEAGITDIPWGAFYGCYNMLSVNLPATLESMNTEFLINAYSLRSLQVEEGGTIYTEDGVLFSAKDKSLLLYPRYLQNASYTVPEGTIRIAYNAINGNGSLKELILPESLEEIMGRALQISGLESLYIPKNVRYIDMNGIRFCDYLTEITVDADNPYYKSVDGILFTEDMTVLHTYPMGRTAAEYTVPDTVVIMPAAVYTQVRQLKKLNIPASVEEICAATGWSGGCVLEEIVVDPDNAYFCSEDGVLYSKDKTVLYHYPACKEEKEYHIPDSVTTTMSLCIYDADYLETLYVGKNIADVRDAILGGTFPRLTGVYFQGDFPDYFWKAFNNLLYRGTKCTFYYPEGAEGWSSPTMEINGFTFTTAAYTPDTADIPAGDITGDGTTDQNDLSLLTQYFSGYPTEIDESAVDLDGNGKLTRKDVMILARYLAGWDGYDQYFS
ncbi:MAG: leucine-rich repeat protein [Clostridia bacterium]|nr:leucine-rich repeat protein [Clostridia bacterium]